MNPCTLCHDHGVEVSSETQLLTGYRRIIFTSAGRTETFELSDPYATALIETLDADKDRDLGRWRWTKDRDYVVYPVEGGFSVFNERRGVTEFRNGLYVHDMEGEAARDYSVAHPERPAANAKAGEIWELTIEDGSEHTVFVHEDRTTGGRGGVSSGGAYFDIDDGSNIVSASKVWGSGVTS